MHGFAPRVSEEEHEFFTKMIIEERFRKNGVRNILWGNATPIPDDFIINKPNSEKGPTSINHQVTEENVIMKNETIKREMENLNVELIDLYSIVKPIHKQIQRGKGNIHFSGAGDVIIANAVSKRLKDLSSNKIDKQNL